MLWRSAPFPHVVRSASLSRAFLRPPTWSRPGRSGCTRSSTMASASSADATAIACACSRGVATIGPTAYRQLPKALAALRVKSVTLDGEGVVCGEDGVADFDRLRAPSAARARATHSCTRSTCLKLMAPTCAATLGTCGGRRWQAYCAKPAKAFGCPSIWTAPTAPLCFGTLAQWAWRASSPSAAIGRIGPGGRRTGSRSRTRMHRRRQGLSSG